MVKFSIQEFVIITHSTGWFSNENVKYHRDFSE